MELSIELIVLVTITGICSVIFACASKYAAPVFFVGIIFTASISAPIVYGQLRPQTWVGPLQIYRSHLFVAASGMLLLNLFIQSRRSRSTAMPLNSALMVVTGVLMGILMALQGDPIQGVLSAIAAMISLGAVIFLLTQTKDYRSGFYLFAGSVCASNCIINGIIILQFLINPSAMLSSEWSRRFQGLTGNPQFLGVQLAIVITILSWLFINVRSKLLWAILTPLIGMNCLFLFWTGSRTSLGMFVIGISIAMVSRFKRAAIALPIAAAGFAVVHKVIGNVLSDVDTSRLTSLQNTREGAWTRLIEVYLANPIIGAGFTDGEVDKSENSFLYGLAGYGTGMGLLYILVCLTTLIMLYKLYKLRRRVDIATRGMIDLVIAVNAAFFAGTVLEGYFVARVNVVIVLFVGINVVGYQLLRQTVSAPLAAPASDPADSTDHEPHQADTEEASDLNYAELVIA